MNETSDMLTVLRTSAHDLRAIPDTTVHAIITSPPYYGLRAYSGEQDVEWPTVEYRLNEWTEPITVQGCEAGCEHEWFELRTNPQTGGDGKTSTLNAKFAKDGTFHEEGKSSIKSGVVTSRYCTRCGGWRGPLGLESSPVAYIGHLILCLREWGRVLRKDGCIFVNLGDSFAANRSYQVPDNKHVDVGNNAPSKVPTGLKQKDLLGIPFMLAFAARADGWYLRSAITWIKGNPMPESVTDRPTKATEMIFLLAKSQRYYYDLEATRKLSNTLNRVNSSEKVVLETGANRASSGGFTSQRGDVSLNDQWTPHLILSSLLTTKWILVKERNDYLSQIFDAFQAPLTRGIGFAILSRLLIMNSPTNVLGYVFKHFCIVLSEADLQGETELRVRLRSIGATAMEGYDGSFPIEEASEIISKIVANAQAIRDTISVNTLTEGIVDIDMVCKSIALLQCSNSDASHAGDGLITEAILEKFLLAFSEFSEKQRFAVESHDKSPFDDDTNGDVGSDYTTKQPSGANLRDWWYVNTQPYPGAHYAVFPERLVEPMIKASTSEAGCCSACGAPWRRVVEKSDRVQAHWPNTEQVHAKAAKGKHGVTSVIETGSYQTYSTIGWQPTCTCDAGEPVPCKVLDPFSGSGTTARVAIRLGRHAIVSDISNEYLSDHVPGRTTVQMEML